MFVLKNEKLRRDASLSCTHDNIDVLMVLEDSVAVDGPIGDELSVLRSASTEGTLPETERYLLLI